MSRDPHEMTLAECEAFLTGADLAQDLRMTPEQVAAMGPASLRSEVRNRQSIMSDRWARAAQRGYRGQL